MKVGDTSLPVRRPGSSGLPLSGAQVIELSYSHYFLVLKHGDGCYRITGSFNKVNVSA